ncbi:MAG: molybdopterin cofactor-binding domain-containing protein, partial [Tissierellaceae bacterium]
EYAASLAGIESSDLEIVDGIIRTIDSSRRFPKNIYARRIFLDQEFTPLGDEEFYSSITFTELAHYAHSQEKQFMGLGSINNTNAPPWYCSFADVSVDMDTGRITLNNFVGVHDVGTVINPDCVEGQINGGNLQGIGYALGEALTYDERTGIQYVNEIQQYMQPTIMGTPDMGAYYVEEKEPNGPFGAKGLGETPCISPVAAIVNAVCNALDIDDDDIKVPLTPQVVLDMIKKNS